MYTVGSTLLILSCLGLLSPSASVSVKDVSGAEEQEEPISATIAGITSAAAAAVSAGTSVAGTTMSALMSDGYAVTCGIEVENWTKYAFTIPIAHVKGGTLSVPPIAILPAKREVMISHKASGTATGVYGTVSWLIESPGASHQRRLVVMWSAPYDFNLHSNTLAVGLTSPGDITHPSGPTWFDKMYYDEQIATLKYIKKEFIRDFSPIIYEDTDYQVVATMGSSHKAQVKIHIRPKNFDDLAANIKSQIQRKK
ncbi:tereporin-Ca1-like [Mercenaria mercenaria]|uniref:tereporin-Ca1-like n=1 Tax=Mercenaria mercenaria TaxID=6596 RepID=UPI00234E7C10|nr:tereporin-Ca1-like [Mercenaria mercenaria]